MSDGQPRRIGRVAPALPRGVRLAGTGLCVPDKRLTNDELAKLVDTTDEWITQRTGIRERRIVEPGTCVRDLARQALLNALADAGMAATQLDMLILATITPEMSCPSTAARVVAEVGATPAGAMDISAACSGFVYGTNVAASLIASGAYQTVAVIGAETLSRFTDWKDRRTCILWGDGAAAAIYTASDDPQQGCLHQTMGSDGSGWVHLYCPRKAEHIPADDTVFSGQFDTLQMNGREVFKFAVSTLQNCIEQTLQACELQPDDLAMIIPHQSNQRILESTRQRLGLAEEKMFVNIDRYGNTSAASIPIGLHELRAAGRLKPGDLILLVGLGGGLTWATSLWRL
jgi:3-oxoacyl-[acyl-carrier-protein] synthase-3